MQNTPKTDKRSRSRAPKSAGWTRARVARELGVSVSYVRKLEASKRLRPRVDDAGVHTFRAAEVEELRGKVGGRRSVDVVAAAEGAIAARAFALLDAGADWRELVRVLEVPPARAEELARSYRQQGEVVLPPAVVAELAQLGAADAAGVVTGRGVVSCLRRMRERLRALRAGSPQPPAVAVH